jgi:hypothetical protein
MPLDEVIRFALYYEGKRIEGLKVGSWGGGGGGRTYSPLGLHPEYMSP